MKTLREVIVFLQRAADKADFLESEARLAINCGKSDKYKEFLIKRAEIIKNIFPELPKELEVENWNDILVSLAYESEEAKEAIESKNVLFLSVLLIDKGSKEIDKNRLEVLIQKLRAL